MAGSQHGPDDESGTPRAGAGSPPPRPTWVKVLGIVLALVIVAFVVAALAGGGHGPRRHLPGGGPAGHTPPVQHDS